MLPEASAGCPECLPGEFNEHFPMQSAPDGESVAYEGSPFTATGGAPVENSYLSTRAASGWQTRGLSPALAADAPPSGYKAFSTDLSHAVLYAIPSLSDPEAPEGYPDLYLQDTASAALRPLLSAAAVEELPAGLHRAPSGGNELKFLFAGASADFSHLFFQANDALTPETATAPEAQDGGEAKDNLYEWSNGSLRLVNVLPDGTTEPGASFGQLKNPSRRESRDFSHAVSADGRRVFWTSAAGQLYVRENGESTLEVPDPARFLTASADGSQVLLSDGKLYAVGPTEVSEETDLTQGHPGTFQGILGQSEGLSTVYFVDTAVLAGENAEGDEPTAGADNLYRFHEGATSYLTALAPADNQTNIGRTGPPEGIETGDWRSAPSDRTAQVTPDGGFLAFMAGSQVYEYDAAAQRLRCASCNPTGASPLGPSYLILIRNQVK